MPEILNTPVGGGGTVAEITSLRTTLDLAGISEVLAQTSRQNVFSSSQKKIILFAHLQSVLMINQANI